MTVHIYIYMYPMAVYIIISIHVHIILYAYIYIIYIYTYIQWPYIYIYIITWSAMQRLWTELGMLRNLLHHAGVILQSMLCNILHDNGKPELLWHRVRRNLVLPGVNEYQPLQGDIEMTSDDEKMPPPFHILRVQIWPPAERVKKWIPSKSKVVPSEVWPRRKAPDPRPPNRFSQGSPNPACCKM